MITLSTPVEQINKIGAATAKKLQRLEIKTAQDLLQYYPFRYEDYSQTVAIKDLKPGITANIQGELEFIQNKRSFQKRMMITEALINDGTGQLKVAWFNQPFIGKNLKAGDKVSLAGIVQGGFLGLEMVAPEYEKIGLGKLAHTTGLVPIYHVTANLTNKQARFLIKSIIGAASQFEDILPEATRRKYQLLDLAKALVNIHFPQSQEILIRARRRLQFEELFLLQLKTQIQKLEIKNQKSAIIKFFKEETNKFVQSLPFKLTAAQKKAAWEIIKDIGQDKPMARLLEGDVGSGKTVTAAIAMLNVALNKKQSALLVPTEILAGQHFETLAKLFKGVDISMGLFTRTNRKVVSLKSYDLQLDVSKEKLLKAVKDGKTEIVVGTHALIQEAVEFRDLALAVIDEQHRFGVEQRQALRQKSGNKLIIPHLLSMTATPIPRSLAQVIYGDLDLSIINELPKGRKKIATFLVPEPKRPGAYDFIKKEIANGRQAFVVCPLISPSDKLGVKSVEEEYKKLNEHVFPELKIAYLHGRLKPPEKEKIMREFLANDVKILVSTSVVEVGVDAPNASVMIIEGAERFGLAQLHQFRGRVGRSAHQSYCLLFTESLNEQTRNRLTIFTKSNDGFKLAEADLRQRGPGEVYGTAQKGFPEFKIATLNDYTLIKETKEAAENIASEGIEKYPKLLERIEKTGEYVVG
ncbi:DNA helicase RecG [Candidatus Falkowbacteria bacterium CG10_big_fil_rev_8_21_14_0_10_43_11]|uniref:ATP-dependent DNA helicase RecG n=1 Tax=Candidatus Falkowbacteria bacterium CG10_big_fil_rev_8_21_14_0_10_43_11 TaxID=1974568 RepID=A0A2M6WN07_9BACT|nr:MAG: DNA helicase RecG [Candidatus Falkowbacteria bacterium CG10_big_fil_rev_8_21_14_0_10_43_11]